MIWPAKPPSPWYVLIACVRVQHRILEMFCGYMYTLIDFLAVQYTLKSLCNVLSSPQETGPSWWMIQTHMPTMSFPEWFRQSFMCIQVSLLYKYCKVLSARSQIVIEIYCEIVPFGLDVLFSLHMILINIYIVTCWNIFFNSKIVERERERESKIHSSCTIFWELLHILRQQVRKDDMGSGKSKSIYLREKEIGERELAEYA